MLHYENNVHFLYPTLLKNYNLFKQCILNAAKNKLTNRLIDLLDFVSENLTVPEKLLFKKRFISQALILYDNPDVSDLYLNLVNPTSSESTNKEIKKNNYLSFREFIPYLNFKESIHFVDEHTITLDVSEAIRHKFNNTALIAITYGTNINMNEQLYKDGYDKNTWVFCMPSLFNAIYIIKI